MKNAPCWFITIAIVYSILGMLFGIWMGMNEAFQYAHFHAHVNLIGWASFALFGLVYRAYPAMAASRLTAAHFWTANVGALIFIPGIFYAIVSRNVGPVVLGSLVVLASQLIFLVNFLRHRNA